MDSAVQSEPSLEDLRVAVASNEYNRRALATIAELYLNSQYDRARFQTTLHGIHVVFPTPPSAPEADAGIEAPLSVYFHHVETPEGGGLTRAGWAELHIQGADGQWYGREGMELTACEDLYTELQGRFAPHEGDAAAVEALLEAFLSGRFERR